MVRLQGDALQKWLENTGKAPPKVKKSKKRLTTEVFNEETGSLEELD